MDHPPPRCILIIEDHLPTAAIMTRLVRARGFRVVTAHTVAEARQLARQEDVGFVISDLGLADGDGCEFMVELNQQRVIPGAAITGFGMEADIARSERAGFMLHLTKPIQAAELERVLVVARRELDGSAPPFPEIH